MLLLAPTPSPAPVVTVTQTVVLPPSPVPTPIVNVTVPSNGTDWGPVIAGFIITLCVAFLAAYLAARDGRRARAEERRTTQANAFLDVTHNLIWNICHGDTEAIAGAVSSFAAWGPRMVGLYGNTKEHKRYAMWLEGEIRAVIPKLYSLVSEAASKGQMTLLAMNEVAADLACIQGSTIKWIQMRPKNWQPDYQAKREFQKEQAAMAGDAPPSFAPENAEI